jgi:predicted aconitase with swiveling domain
MSRTIYGRGIIPGNVEGYALVSRTLLSLLDGLDPETGTIVQKDHELEGMSIAGKILVVYGERGSTAGVWKFIGACHNNRSPKGVIVPRRMGFGVVSGAIECKIPLITVEKENLDYINSGNYIKMVSKEHTIEKANDHFVVKSGEGIIEILDKKIT